MLHEVKIEQEKGSTCTHVLIDGKSVRCFGYDISQVAGELPKIQIDLLGSLDLTYYSDKIAIKLLDTVIENIDMLIEVIDEEMFNEFCSRWHEVHD